MRSPMHLVILSSACYRFARLLRFFLKPGAFQVLFFILISVVIFILTSMLMFILVSILMLILIFILIFMLTSVLIFIVIFTLIFVHAWGGRQGSCGNIPAQPGHPPEGASARQPGNCSGSEQPRPLVHEPRTGGCSEAAGPVIVLSPLSFCICFNPHHVIFAIAIIRYPSHLISCQHPSVPVSILVFICPWYSTYWSVWLS